MLTLFLYDKADETVVNEDLGANVQDVGNTFVIDVHDLLGALVFKFLVGRESHLIPTFQGYLASSTLQ